MYQQECINMYQLALEVVNLLKRVQKVMNKNVVSPRAMHVKGIHFQTNAKVKRKPNQSKP
jgi:hypothetical protein